VGRHRIASEEAVLDAAVRSISRHGLAQLTLADVAAEAGLTAPTLVQRFGSKRGLLLAVSRYLGTAVKQAFESARARHRSPLAALVAALSVMTMGVTTPGGIANHLSFLQLDLTDPEFRSLAQAHSREFRTNINALLRQAMADGELPHDDLEGLARTVQVVFSGVLVQWAIDGDRSLEFALRSEINRLLGVIRS